MIIIGSGYKEEVIATFSTIIFSDSLSRIDSGFLTQYLGVDYYILNTISRITKSK